MDDRESKKEKQIDEWTKNPTVAVGSPESSVATLNPLGKVVTTVCGKKYLFLIAAAAFSHRRPAWNEKNHAYIKVLI